MCIGPDSSTPFQDKLALHKPTYSVVPGAHKAERHVVVFETPKGDIVVAKANSRERAAKKALEQLESAS
jgi:hypothetical protein